MSTNQLDSLRRRLNQSKGRWPRICEETGLGYSWLSKFAQGQINNPTYKKVSVLSSYFADREIA